MTPGSPPFRSGLTELDAAVGTLSRSWVVSRARTGYDATRVFRPIDASRCILIATLGAGIFARISELGKRSFWYDELFCVASTATTQSVADLWDQWLSVDGHPPGYMLALYGLFQLAPATEIAARIPSCVMGLLALALLACAPERRLPRGAAFYAAAIYAFAIEPIYYAQTARQYGFLITCSLGALLEWAELYSGTENKRAGWTRLTVWLLAAAYLHYFALLLTTAIFGVALVRALRNRSDLGLIVASAAGFILAYLPGLVALARTVSLRIAGWQRSDPLPDVLMQLLERGFVRWWWLLLGALALAVIAALIQRLQVQLRLTTDPRFQAIAWVFAVLVVEFAIVSRFGPFLQLRYALVLYAPSLLVAAWILSRLAPVEDLRGVFVLVAIATSGLAAYSDYRGKPKQDWRASAERVIDEHTATDAIYVLGANPRTPPLDYLRRGRVDDYFYCRNLPFYAYYFRRLSAPVLATALRHLPMPPEETESVLLSTKAATIFVLAPHHTRLQDPSIERLKAAGIEVDDTPLFSTHLYRLRRH